MTKIAALLLTILSVTSTAEARIFYKRVAQVSLTYSNIQTGTTSLFTDVPYEFRYSDDNTVCLLLVNGKQLECTSNRSGQAVAIRLRSHIMEQYLNSLLSSSQSSYATIVSRILSTTKETFDLNYTNAGGVKQIHDPQPESFHVIFTKFGPEIQLRDAFDNASNSSDQVSATNDLVSAEPVAQQRTSNECSVLCGQYSSYQLPYVRKILATPPQNVYWPDFRKYCDSLGGYISKITGCARAACLSAQTIAATGTGFGTNLYEARQNARNSCVANLPPSSKSCAAGSYHYNTSYTQFRVWNCQ